jgi:alkylation response protein AidB-like acyl-CoA dehydrogenase
MSVSTAFALAPEQMARWQEMRDLARDQLAPLLSHGKPGRVNRELVRALGRHGLIERALPTPEAGTRSSISVTDLCLTREALAQESPEAETAFALQGLGGYPLLAFGSCSAKEAYGDGIRTGELVVAFALSEPNAGSDVSRIAVRAERVDGGYRLTGTKKWISNAPDADVYALFARTSDAPASRALTGFVVRRDAEGLDGRPLELLAAHPIGELHLDGVFVADDAVLGEPGRGFGVAMETLNLFRPSVGAFAVGMAQAALDAAVEHCRHRELFGKTLAEMQSVGHSLADAATQLEAARLLVYRAAALADAGGAPAREPAAMAKLFATEMAQRVIDLAIQLHGAAALEVGHRLEHLYRDVRATRIYEGASEIQREIIARSLLQPVGG